MRGIMYMIPLAYRETCRVLSDHLRLVAANDEKNKMTLRNLELTWSLSVGQMTGAVMRVLAEEATPIPSTLQYRLPLDVAVENAPRGLSDKPTVPYAVTRLVEYLNQNGAFSVPHLFNSEPRSIELIEDIIYVLNGGSLGDGDAFPAETTPIDAAIALKQWIADIPGLAGIFPESMRPDFAHAVGPILNSPAPSPAPSADGEVAAPSQPPAPAHVNFSQMPDRLEPLFWKLPEPYLQTIKMLLGLLRSWTTFAPEDISSLLAVQSLFVDYPLPLQHVLAYLLHSYDQLFAGEDLGLTAHLQGLVFASPVATNGTAAAHAPGTFYSRPLSPRQQPKHAHTQTSTPSSTTANTATGSPASGGDSAIAGDSSTASSDPQDETLDGEHQHPEENGTSATGAAVAAAIGSQPNTPGSPSGKIKKVKSHKEKGSSPASGASGKVKRVREAEDGDLSTPTRKNRSGGLSKTKSTSDSPSKNDSPSKRSASPSKGKTSDDNTPTRTRHLKTSSADVESSPSSSGGKGARSGSKGSSKTSTKESSGEISGSPPRKPLSRSPSTDESSDDSANGEHHENGNGKVTTPSKREKRTRLSREVTDDPELALKKNGDGTHEKVRRSKSSSSAGSTPVSPSPSGEDLSIKKTKAPKKLDDSDGAASNDTNETPSGTPELSPEKATDANGSAKKKKKKDPEMETVTEEGEPSVEPEGASTPKSRKKNKSDDNESPSGSTEKRKKSEKRSKSNDPPTANIDSNETADVTNGSADTVASPKKSRKGTTGDDIASIPSSKKASRIKVSTPLADAP